MGRGADTPGDPMISPHNSPAVRLGIADMKGPDDVAATTALQAGTDRERAQISPIPPFVLGTVIGGLAGAILGTALSPHTRGYLIGLYQLTNRRLSSAERDQLRFELLLQ